MKRIILAAVMVAAIFPASVSATVIPPGCIVTPNGLMRVTPNGLVPCRVGPNPAPRIGPNR